MHAPLYNNRFNHWRPISTPREVRKDRGHNHGKRAISSRAKIPNRKAASRVSNNPNSNSENPPDTHESFGDLLSQFEREHTRQEGGDRRIQGTVVAISADSVFVDINFKTEGILPLSIFVDAGQPVAVGDSFPVSVKGRNPEGYYELSRIRVEQPKDWEALEKAFRDQAPVSGTVTAMVKGGVTVDIGVRAFMPASRTGVREAAEIEKLVGQEIRCRITKLDAATEDVVVDRRALMEEDERATKERRYSEVNAGDVMHGTVRSLAAYGAFVDLGGVDGLIHIREIAWTRVSKVEDLLSVGQQVEVKVVKIEPETRRIALSMKQLLPHTWEGLSDRHHIGDRVRGTVTRLTDFGAFLEIEPGVEGMIHISEMSWGKKVRKPGDLLKTGEIVEAVILGLNQEEHRLALGLKQALGDPWIDAADKFASGSLVEGEVTSFTAFGAFVQLREGVQGLVHISEITAEKRLHHPSDALRLGQQIKAKVVEFDKEKRQLRLSIKQMAPTGLEDFLIEHKPGDIVTGRILAKEDAEIRVELGEGVIGSCTLPAATAEPESPANSGGGVDLSSLTSMLSARWKSGTSSASTKKPEISTGQVRSFRIADLDASTGSIRLELAD